MKLILETENQILENKIKMIFYWAEHENMCIEDVAAQLAFHIPACSIETFRTSIFVWETNQAPAAAIFFGPQSAEMIVDLYEEKKYEKAN